MQRLIPVIVALLLWGCSPGSLEDYQKEGESLSRRIISELQSIHTTQELVARAPLLKQHFYSLVDLMIEARLYQEKHPDEEPSFTQETFNELFVIELERIYGLERGREIIESTQRDAMNRLDAFERKLKKRREKLVVIRE